MEICQSLLGGALGFQGLGDRRVQGQLELSARVLIALRPSGIHLTSSFQELLYFPDSALLLNGQEEGRVHEAQECGAQVGGIGIASGGGVFPLRAYSNL